MKQMSPDLQVSPSGKTLSSFWPVVFFQRVAHISVIPELLLEDTGKIILCFNSYIFIWRLVPENKDHIKSLISWIILLEMG